MTEEPDLCDPATPALIFTWNHFWLNYWVWLLLAVKGRLRRKTGERENYSRFQQVMTPICMHNLQHTHTAHSLLQASLIGNSLITAYPTLHTHTHSQSLWMWEARSSAVISTDLWHAWGKPSTPHIRLVLKTAHTQSDSFIYTHTSLLSYLNGDTPHCKK